MFPLAVLFSFALVLCILPGGYAGPACTRKYYQTAQCVQKCQTRWGYPGSMMGTNRWGAVMQHVDEASTAGWTAVIAEACGMPSNSKEVSTDSGDNSGDGDISGAVGSNPDDSIETVTLATTSASNFQTAASENTSSLESSSTSTSKKSSKTPPPSPHPPAADLLPPQKETTTSPTKQKAAPTPNPTPDKSNNDDNGGDSGSQEQSGDIAQYLKAHNDFRSQHGAAPLTWNDNLASKAQEWANKCVFKHSGGSLGPFGENLAAGTGSSYGIPAAIKSWTDESKDYDPNNPVFSHFTQVVWKSSKQLGCALQECDGIFDPKFGKAKFVVCEYDPPGNFNNEFAQNVQV